MRRALKTENKGARNTAQSGRRPPLRSRRQRTMPRKGWVVRRRIPGDPVFGSDLVQKFISSMMYDGKRSTAQTIFYDAMDQVSKKTNDDAFKLFKKAVEN